MQIEAKVFIKEAKQRLDKFRSTLKDHRTPNRMVAAQLYSWTIRNFQQEGALVGGWTPVTEATRKRKEREGKEKLLVRTGALRASFVPFADNENAGIGSELEYSWFHQYSSPSRNLPARPMLPTREYVDETGVRVYDFYVKQLIRDIF